jgi:hypothetical protein
VPEQGAGQVAALGSRLGHLVGGLDVAGAVVGVAAARGVDLVLCRVLAAESLYTLAEI